MYLPFIITTSRPEDKKTIINFNFEIFTSHLLKFVYCFKNNILHRYTFYTVRCYVCNVYYVPINNIHTFYVKRIINY